MGMDPPSKLTVCDTERTTQFDGFTFQHDDLSSYVGLPGGNELYNGDLTIEDGDFLVLAPNVPTILGKKYQINEQS